MNEISYGDLNPPNYVNTNPVGTLGGVDVYLQDVGIAALLAGLPAMYRGNKSTGKTQLMRDFFSGYFNGSEFGLWEEGRSDFRPKELFQSLNISLAKGNVDGLPEIKAVYTNGNLEYLIRSCKDEGGELQLTWDKISAEKRENIIADYSITTKDLVALQKLDTKAFFIDEFNRCPEVVMNLFYGLMHGEITHDGEIIKLGNGYYTGIAASNPDDYEGTFKMDAAMWSRFRVVLDFTAYETGIADDKKLIIRKEVPGIVKRKKGNLTYFLEITSKEIQETDFTVKEQILLAYFKRGLGLCTNEKLGGSVGISKEHIHFPRDCTGCEKVTTICGLLKGIDQRSLDSLKYLAKGLEKLTKLKAGEDIKLDPLESLLLAYNFVAPYKGVINPKTVKDKRGIEALVLKEQRFTLTTIVNDKFNDLDEVVREESQLKKSNYSLQRLKEEFEKINLTEEYEKIIKDKMKKFEIERTMSVQEFKERFPEEVDKLRGTTLQEHLNFESKEYRTKFFEFLRSETPQRYAEIDKNLLGPLGWDERKYKRQCEKSDTPHSEFKNRLKEELKETIGNDTKILLQLRGFQNFLFSAMNISQEIEEKVTNLVEERTKDQTIRYVPKEKETEVKREARIKLNQFLAEFTNEEFRKKKEGLFKGEWSFLKSFYPAYVEESQNVYTK